MNLLKLIKNTFLFKCYNQLRGKFVYPIEILPKWYYINNIDIDSLVYSHQFDLIRHSPDKKEDIFKNLDSEYEQLRETSLSLSEIPNLSTNILGGLFKLNHLIFRLNMKSEANERWNGKKYIFLQDYLNGYDFHSGENTPIYINANKIHNTKIPYNQHESKQINKELEKISKLTNENFDFEIINGSKAYKIDGTLKVSHDPLNLNYWHSEIKLSDFFEQDVKYKSASHKNICKQALIDIICLNSSSVRCSNDKISKMKYIKRIRTNKSSDS